MRGVISQGFIPGRSVAGDPLTQKAYVTPQFPSGISASELKRAPHDVQQATVLFWFYSNFRPFSGEDETGQPLKPKWGVRGGAYGEGAYGQGPYGGYGERYVIAPLGSTYGSAEIRSEFVDVVSPDVLLALGSILDNDRHNPEGLPSLWEIIPLAGLSDLLRYVVDPQGNFITTPTGERIVSADRADIVNAILSRLTAVEAIIDRPAVAHGDFGHNNPPEEPLTDTDKDIVRLSISQLRELLAERSADAEDVQQAAAPLVSSRQNIVDWFGKRTTAFMDATLKAAGTTFGTGIGGYLTFELFHRSLALFHLMDEVIRLIGQLH